MTLVLIQPGELFVAIRGPRHDGHDFVAGALARGAAAGVVARERWRSIRRKSADTALCRRGHARRAPALARGLASSGGEAEPGSGAIGAVTGSVGKTTTKEILAALVAARFRVLKPQGNLNNEYGLPLTLF